MKNYDESKVLNLVSKRCRIDYSNKTIQASKGTIIGINMWGKIDFLTNYCGWHFVWNNDVKSTFVDKTDNPTNRELKKEKKAPKLTNKRK